MATTKSNRPTTATSARATVRQRLGAVMEATLVEGTLDRLLTKRLRPMREEVREARVAFEEQTLLRAEAEIRAARAEDEAKALRVRVAQLESELAAVRAQPSPWWRRRRIAEQQPA